MKTATACMDDDLSWLIRESCYGGEHCGDCDRLSAALETRDAAIRAEARGERAQHQGVRDVSDIPSSFVCSNCGEDGHASCNRPSEAVIASQHITIERLTAQLTVARREYDEAAVAHQEALNIVADQLAEARQGLEALAGYHWHDMPALEAFEQVRRIARATLAKINEG